MTATVPGRPGRSSLVQPALTPAPPTGRAGTALAGTATLIRLALRRDRILLPAWLVGFVVMVTTSVVATRDLYPSDESLVSAAETINATAALVALYGKIYQFSLGAVSLIKLTSFGAAVVAIVFVFLVVRHTRGEEESGRLELVSAGVVGRAAPLAAALAVGMGGSVVLGVLSALGCAAGGLPWSGSVAFGLSWALSGIVFSALAGVAAQVTTSARTATGLGLLGVAVAYALRAVGDLAEGDPGWASWLSPIGWSQQIRPFAGDRWWVSALPLATTLLLVPLAFLLRARRDLGSGLLADRPGPASGRLGTASGLAWRLQRGMLVTWVLAAALFGLVLGSVAHNISGLLDSPEIRRFFEQLGGEQGLTDMFLAAEIGILGALVAAYGIAATARLRTEESAGHAEAVLATATTRLRWAASHLTVALAGTTLVMVTAGLGIGLGHGLAVGDVGEQASRMAGAAAAQLPAVWVMVGIVLLLFGWVPLAVPAAWGVLVGFVLLGEFGALWGLPQVVMDLSPFAHSPRLPGGSVEPGQLAMLLAVALVLSALGLVGWSRRDLQA